MQTDRMCLINIQESVLTCLWATTWVCTLVVWMATELKCQCVKALQYFFCHGSKVYREQYTRGSYNSMCERNSEMTIVRLKFILYDVILFQQSHVYLILYLISFTNDFVPFSFRFKLLIFVWNLLHLSDMMSN